MIYLGFLFCDKCNKVEHHIIKGYLYHGNKITKDCDSCGLNTLITGSGK